MCPRTSTGSCAVVQLRWQPLRTQGGAYSTDLLCVLAGVFCLACRRGRQC
jgi:hypothetical protein